ncbi:MAG: class I SAM-dependent methyltransferase [Campylobacterales bacterium]|nr:class I SAM-dependent methyltransferase [Campylobacterales bacterium]
MFEAITPLLVRFAGRVLDVGCGSKPYKKYCVNSSEYVGLEIDTPENRRRKKADFFYDGSRFPFENNSFDCVLSNEVFEHVFNPVEFLSEINRVLKKEGLLLISVPFVWDEHEQPHDYARYSSFGLKYNLEKAGFEILEARKTINSVAVIFQLLNAYIYKITVTKNGFVNIIIAGLLMSPFNIIGVVLSKVLPKNNDLYLDNVVLAKKIQDV